MKKVSISLYAILFLCTVFPAGSSFAKDCSKYFGKGYCVDYIQHRLGKRPRGNAGTWSPNINNKDVKAGDVAIFSSPAPYGHVAIVERVIYERNTDRPFQVEITEWNWGATMVDRDCAVTNMFGKTSRRTVLVSRVKGFWRS